MIYVLYLEDDLICNAITIKESINSNSHDISTVGIICLTPNVQNSLLELLNSTIECLLFKKDSADYYTYLCSDSNITIKIPSFWPDTNNGLLYADYIPLNTITIDTPLVEFYGTIECQNFKSDGSINNIHTLQLFDNEQQSYWEVIINNNVNVTYTSLQNSKITGNGEHNALVSNGCIDRGGNTGWNFGEPTPSNKSVFLRFNDINIAKGTRLLPESILLTLNLSSIITELSENIIKVYINEIDNVVSAPTTIEEFNALVLSEPILYQTNLQRKNISSLDIDITELIKKVINLETWSPGNSIMLVLKNDDQFFLKFFDISENTSKAAYLSSYNIEFVTLVTRYWVPGGSGIFSNTNNWSLTSGGSSGASVPSNGDTIIFDSNSLAVGSDYIEVYINSNVNCIFVIESEVYYILKLYVIDSGVLSLINDLEYIHTLEVQDNGEFNTNNYDIIVSDLISFQDTSVSNLGTSTITFNAQSEQFVSEISLTVPNTLPSISVTSLVV